MYTCLPADSQFSSHLVLYLPQSWRPTCHQQTCWCLMVVGAFSTLPAANGKPDGLQGEQREGLSRKAGLPLYHHANRDSSTEPGAPQPDKAPRQSCTEARPHSLQWTGQTRERTWPTTLTVLPSARPLCFHTTPAKSVLIPPKTRAIWQCWGT